jgi:hypothetical protein
MFQPSYQIISEYFFNIQTQCVQLCLKANKSSQQKLCGNVGRAQSALIDTDYTWKLNLHK